MVLECRLFALVQKNPANVLEQAKGLEHVVDRYFFGALSGRSDFYQLGNCVKQWQPTAVQTEKQCIAKILVEFFDLLFLGFLFLVLLLGHHLFVLGYVLNHLLQPHFT